MISRKLQFIVAFLVVAILTMGFYLVDLKRKAESISPPVAQALVPPVSGPAEQTTLYLANDDEDSLRPITLSTALPGDPGERGRLALHMLIARYLQKDSRIPSVPEPTCRMSICSTRPRPSSISMPRLPIPTVVASKSNS